MLRLVSSVLLFLLSLLAIFRAPQYHLWMLAILVTEFCWIFMALTAMLLALPMRHRRFRLATRVFAVCALLLFASPIIRAVIVARSLEGDMTAAFGAGSPAQAPPGFDPTKWFTSWNTRSIVPKSYTYVSYPGLDLTLDLYPAKGDGIRPCVIIVHGGSWRGGDNKQLPELNTWLAGKGYHAVAINYRKAPQYHNPAPVEDVAAAMKWLRQHAAELRIDTGNFVLVGRSAGAQIALMAAYSFHDPSIKGAISFYGPADMVWGYSLPANPLVMDSRKVMQDYLGGTYEQVPIQYRNSSATYAVTEHTPPTLMIHGLNDPLVAYEHNTRLIKQLEAHHRPYFLLTLPWATHGCDYTLRGPSGQLSVYAIERFLASVLKR